MLTGCLEACPGCERHVRCGERVCPFCGARVESFMRVLEYRVVTRLNRSHAFSLGAALTAAGFASSCVESVPEYGAPCNPPSCVFPGGATGGGAGASGGGSGGLAEGGAGSQGEGGALGVAGADTTTAGATGEGGLTGGEGGATGEGGAAGGEGGAAGQGGDTL